MKVLGFSVVHLLLLVVAFALGSANPMAFHKLRMMLTPKSM